MIEYVEYGAGQFGFTIQETLLRVYTVIQARKTIDNFLKAKALLGKKIIGFSSRDGSKIITTIKKIGFTNANRIQSQDIAIEYFDEGGIIATNGPFLEFNDENNKLADTYLKYSVEMEDIENKRREIWTTLEKKWLY